MSLTPILDLEQEPPKAPKGRVARVVGGAIGLAISAAIVLSDQGVLVVRWSLPGSNGLLLLPALYVAIAGHELGHLVVGKMAGMDAGGFSVGPFTWSKSGANWVFRFERQRWLGGFFKPLTGRAGMSPSQCLWMAAGGPVASVLMAVACNVGWRAAGDGMWGWLGTLDWMAGSLALVCFIPSSAGVNRSDAARIWQLLRHPEQTGGWIASVEVQAEETRGVRPRDWNGENFARMMGVDPAASEFLFCQLMAYYRRVDEGAEEAALGHLENTLESTGTAGASIRHAVYLEASAASGMLRKNAAQAREWLARARKIQKPRSTNVPDAAIAMCEGRYADAAKCWRAAIDEADKRRLDSGLIRFAREKWQAHERVCGQFLERV